LFFFLKSFRPHFFLPQAGSQAGSQVGSQAGAASQTGAGSQTGSQTGAASQTGLQHLAFFPQKPPIPPVRARTRMTVFVTDELPKDTLDPGHMAVPNFRVCMANGEVVYRLGRLRRMVRDF
jgi:hypothetical protein